jgi:chromosomal replication initiation ATPase DnaA
MSLTDIGRIFGQDHTTVLYSIQMKYNGERYWGQDQTMWQEFDELIKS